MLADLAADAGSIEDQGADARGGRLRMGRTAHERQDLRTLPQRTTNVSAKVQNAPVCRSTLW